MLCQMAIGEEACGAMRGNRAAVKGTNLVGRRRWSDLDDGEGRRIAGTGRSRSREEDDAGDGDGKSKITGKGEESSRREVKGFGP